MEPPPTEAGPRPGPAPSAPPGGWPGPRQLRRRPDDGHVAGVCAGVADYFSVDPVIVRIAAVVLLFSGPGAFAYVLAWIFVPAAEASDGGGGRGPFYGKDRGTQIFGVVLLTIALSVIWGDWWWPARQWFFPICLMGLGGWLLLRERSDPDDEATPPTPPTPPVPAAAPWEPSLPSTGVPVDADATTADATVVDAPVVDPPDQAADDGGDSGPPTSPWDLASPYPPVPPTPVEPPAARRRRFLGPVVFGALLIWAGVGWLLGVSIQNGLAVGLCLLGLGFVLGAFVGGSRALVLPAIVVGAALAVTAVADIPLSGPIGEQTWTPATAADVEASYEMSVGEGTLDLRAVAVREGAELPVEVSVGIGHLVVLAPADLALDVTTTVGAGESDVLGDLQDGVGVSTSRFDETGTTGGTLVLDLQVGLGQIEVRRVAPTTP